MCKKNKRFGKAPNVKKPIEYATNVSALFFPGSLQIAALQRRTKRKWSERAQQTHLKQAVDSHKTRNFREIRIHGGRQHQQVIVVQLAAAEI